MEARRGGGGGGGGAPNGWPLGLQPLNVRLRVLEHHIRLGDASPFLISTPSISSQSSSDLDTESTGSFFPEKSTTLGTLIGIRSRSQSNQPLGVSTVQLLQSHEHMKKRNGAQRHGCWCALILCCSSSNMASTEESVSPSLAHLLELERRAALSQRQEGMHEGVGEGDDDDYGIEESANTLFDDEGILPPQPYGAPPLKSILQQSSTSSTASSYLSADWSASIPIVRRRKRYQASQSRFHTSLCPSLWKS